MTPAEHKVVSTVGLMAVIAAQEYSTCNARCKSIKKSQKGGT